MADLIYSAIAGVSIAFVGIGYNIFRARNGPPKSLNESSIAAIDAAVRIGDHSCKETDSDSDSDSDARQDPLRSSNEQHSSANGTLMSNKTNNDSKNHVNVNRVGISSKARSFFNRIGFTDSQLDDAVEATNNEIKHNTQTHVDMDDFSSSYFCDPVNIFKSLDWIIFIFMSCTLLYTANRMSNGEVLKVLASIFAKELKVLGLWDFIWSPSPTSSSSLSDSTSTSGLTTDYTSPNSFHASLLPEYEEL